MKLEERMLMSAEEGKGLGRSKGKGTKKQWSLLAEVIMPNPFFLSQISILPA